MPMISSVPFAAGSLNALHLQCQDLCGSRFSFGGWCCGVQILFLLLTCCTDDWQNIGGYVACVHHVTHSWHKLIARR